MDRWTWLALFGLAGCTALPSPPAAVHTYLFSAPFPAPRRGPGPVLLITTPRAAAGYDRPGIAYRRSPTRLDYYAASEWADDPARLVEPLIIAAAEASGGFEAVVSAGTGLTAEIRLDTEIVRIEHELQSAPSQGRLTLRAQLVDAARGRVIGTQIFDASVPSRSDDAEGAVAAIDTALMQVLEQVVAFCVNSTGDQRERRRTCPSASKGTDAVDPGGREADSARHVLACHHGVRRRWRARTLPADWGRGIHPLHHTELAVNW